jgi:hypothetical protein
MTLLVVTLCGTTVPAEAITDAELLSSLREIDEMKIDAEKKAQLQDLMNRHGIDA